MTPAMKPRSVSTTVFTSSIVVTLVPDGDARQALLRWLTALPSVDVGAIESGSCLAIAVQNESRSAERNFWEDLQAHPAVTFASLVFSHVDDDTSPHSPTAQANS
jgi:nitrate reductase NapAB chaperone NapD